MFNDIGPLKLVTLVVLAVLVFGPEKLPKMIQDVTPHRARSTSLGECQGGHPRGTRPGVQGLRVRGPRPPRRSSASGSDRGADELGLEEIRNGFDLKKEMAEVTDAVHSRDTDSSSSSSSSGSSSRFDRHDQEAREDRIRTSARPSTRTPPESYPQACDTA